MPLKPTTDDIVDLRAHKVVNDRLLKILLALLSLIGTILLAGGSYWATSVSTGMREANKTLSKIEQTLAGVKTTADDNKKKISDLEKLHPRN